MTRRVARRTAGAALALGAAVLVVPVGTPPAAMASGQQQAECDLSRTYYEPRPSTVLEGLAIPQTWRTAQGRGVTVAVVDSGINVENAHFPTGSVLPGISLVPGDSSQGLDDTSGHGTAVAGILAARARPDLDSALVGVAPEARLLPVRVYTADGEGAQDTDLRVRGDLVAEGIRRAVEAGADVVNVSISVAPDNIYLPQMTAALELAQKRDVVVVAAAGNAPGQPVDQLRYPAAGPGVIGVAATNLQSQVDDFSVHGEHVDVAAPGAGVLLAFHSNGDCTSSPEQPATSWATPFVAGLAAQLRERYPRASAEEIAYRITSTARRPVADQRDDEQGWGLIQPLEALTSTIDERRPGPAAPSEKEEEVTTTQATGAAPMPQTVDELAPVRREALWWWIGGAGLAAVGLLARPLVRRRAAAGDDA